MTSDILYNRSAWKCFAFNPDRNTNNHHDHVVINPKGPNPCISLPNITKPPTYNFVIPPTNELNIGGNNNHSTTVGIPADDVAQSLINNIPIDNNNNGDGGRIRSLPRRKDEKFTCSRCRDQFSSAQHFASHVRVAHYKDESKEDKAKRLMSRIQNRKNRR
ncbi:MAG: hypothetical protein Q8765_02505 [Sweet potato little leaf phytoplasma]|nr:hypothetical protein [Sweet potato little leaf phytoplasma]